jgi:hypothetical protein
MKTAAGAGTDFFEMNLPHCLLVNVVKKEMEEIGSHIQVIFNKNSTDGHAFFLSLSPKSYKTVGVMKGQPRLH